MTTVKKITSLQELDPLLPMMMKFYDDNNSGLYSISGMIGYIVGCFFLPTFSVWAFYTDSKPIGYVIASIEARYFERECIVINAYTEEYVPNATEICYQEIENWAKHNGCKFLSIYTKREKAFGRKYGFEDCSMYMIKKLEV